MLYYADIIQKLKGLVSDETLYSNIPFIDDPQQEIEKLDLANDYLRIPEIAPEGLRDEQEGQQED